MNTAAFRQNAVRFHGRGSEARHLAQEVSHFVMPLDVQRRIDERLETNRAMIFVGEGAGQGGTTGAHFMSGNVGFGNAGQGASIMDTLFPHSSDGSSSGASSASAGKTNLFDGDGYARQRGGNLFGDASTANGENADGQKLAPDLVAFEEAVKSILMVCWGSTPATTCPTLATHTSTTPFSPSPLAPKRCVVLARRQCRLSIPASALGKSPPPFVPTPPNPTLITRDSARLRDHPNTSHVAPDPHPLHQRYGPNFDPKAKGGIWHKDTCPFGINGDLPPGSLMFTIVYILYTENLNGPTAGTRVRDDDGTVFSLPCVAGEGNIIRSGESDANAFFHSGLRLRSRQQRALQ